MLPRQDIGVEKNKQMRSRIRGRNVVRQREARVLREDDHTQRETIKPEQSLGIPDHLSLSLGGIEHIDQISSLQIAVVCKLNDLVLHQVYAAVERYEYRDSWLSWRSAISEHALQTHTRAVLRSQHRHCPR